MLITEYQITEFLKKLERQAQRSRDELKAWEGVKIVTKKDGKPFANFSKNFEGCKVNTEIYSFNTNDKKMIVYFKSVGGCDYSSLDCYDTGKEAEKHEDISRRYARGAWGSVGYLLTVEEMAERIENKKAHIKKYIKETEEAIKNFEKAVDIIRKAGEEIEALEKENTTLYYTARKMAKLIAI